jgi:23S rRNA (uracil1939-C5)-methyltransferase
VEIQIDDLSHDGRGVGRIEGKAVFVHGALPGERVLFRYRAKRKDFDEGSVVEVLKPSPDRVSPRCEHFGVCGGCVMQHLEPAAQIEAKRKVLQENFRRLGQVEPEAWLAPLVAGHWHYRRRARMSVRHVVKKGKVLVGFRERDGRYVAELSRCHVLIPEVGERLEALGELIGSMDARDQIPQVEVAAGDDRTVLVFRHMQPLSPADLDRLRDFATTTGLDIFLQPKGPTTVRPLDGTDEMHFEVPAEGLNFRFTPTNFVQVNAELNQKMIRLALEKLAPEPQDRILDLFCGLGNFTLPIAHHCQQVVGIEGNEELVSLARSNAERNNIGNAEFHVADLTQDHAQADWLAGGFDQVLVDPPRSGAQEVLAALAALGPRRIVYISCHPGSLARDAGMLVRDHGFRLIEAGVMDMFPHTAHVESIAIFEAGDGH